METWKSSFFPMSIESPLIYEQNVLQILLFFLVILTNLSLQIDGRMTSPKRIESYAVEVNEVDINIFLPILRFPIAITFIYLLHLYSTVLPGSLECSL